MLPDATTAATPDTAAAPAWWQRPYRMVQTNLRQPDALYDQKALAKETRAFGADVLLYNIGGIYAFYPTKLPLHAVNPYMKGDALGAALEAAHAEGLSLVGRFDMSKATRIAYEAHPDWFVHNGKAEALEYNGTYQACVNGGWYQDYSLEIISESLGTYDVDGVFFNMFGYPNSTYSGDYFGICDCDNCLRRFREMYGKALPPKEDFSDPAYADYLEFKDRTSLELRSKVYRHIKQVNPKVAITGHRGDSRPDPPRGPARRRPAAARMAVPGRRAGEVGPRLRPRQDRLLHLDQLRRLRLALRLRDRRLPPAALRPAARQRRDARLLPARRARPGRQEAFAQVSELFHWHAAHEGDYAGLASAARSRSTIRAPTNVHRGRTATAAHGAHAFRGAYRALVESRLPFDFVVRRARRRRRARRLRRPGHAERRLPLRRRGRRARRLGRRRRRPARDRRDRLLRRAGRAARHACARSPTRRGHAVDAPRT